MRKGYASPGAVMFQLWSCFGAKCHVGHEREPRLGESLQSPRKEKNRRPALPNNLESCNSWQGCIQQESKPMRNLIFDINITLDGCCDHTKAIADEEMHEYFTDLLRGADLLVFGRKTYELMVPFWPD